MRKNRRWHCALAMSWLIALWLMPALVAAQQPAQRLSLEQALQRATEVSEQVDIAQAGVKRARGEIYRARSQYLPQFSASGTYIRTLQSEFSSLGDATDRDDEPTVVCPEFIPNPNAPVDQRVGSLEAALVCRDDESPFGDLFSNLPFGRVHQLSGGLALTQTVYSGGRAQAQNRIAAAGQRTAEIDLSSANAQLALDVTQAYYDAALSDQLLAIAEATLAQADTTLAQVRLAKQVGEAPEFELLRAQVTRDNQRPVVIQNRAARDLAYIRLKQLLNLRLDEPIALVTPLAGDEMPVIAVRAMDVDTSVSARAPVRQASEAVRMQESLLRSARGQRLPYVTISSQYGRVAYPVNGLPTFSQFRTNWTVTALVDLPIYTGGRIKGDVMVAEAEAQQARARLQQTRELAALDTRNALELLQAAEASWQASAGTVEQAVKAYSIAEIRFREGISTQLELNDSRIMLQQAQANRAVAARDLQVARMRMTLLPDLPLGTGGSILPSAPAQNAAPASAPALPLMPRAVQPGGRILPVRASQVSNRTGSGEQ